MKNALYATILLTTSTLLAGCGATNKDAPNQTSARARAAEAAVSPTLVTALARTGWANPEAFAEARAARAAEQAGRYDTCVDLDARAMERERHPRVQLHLAGCEMQTGELLDALKNADDALKTGMRDQDPELTAVGKLYVARILARLPHVRFAPTRVTALTMKIDGRYLDPTRCPERGCAFDPGPHSIEAEGLRNGALVVERQSFTVREGEVANVEL